MDDRMGIPHVVGFLFCPLPLPTELTSIIVQHFFSQLPTIVQASTSFYLNEIYFLESFAMAHALA